MNDQTIGQILKKINRLEKRMEDLESQENFIGAESTISVFMNIPGLVGFWPGNVVGTSGLLTDLSGNAQHLTRVSSAHINPLSTSLGTTLLFNGSSDYWYRTDEALLSITGTEGWIIGADRGLSMGAWVYYNNAASAIENIIGKRTGSAGGQLSYYVRRTAAGGLNFQISPDGTAGSSVGVSSAQALGAGQWAFVGCRFYPSTELALWFNKTKAVNTTSIPAGIYDSTAPFSIGANGAPGEYLDGQVGLVWLSAAKIEDDWFSHLFESSRGIFGV